MTLSQFRSLSIGDTVYCGSVPETVSNQYIRVIDNRPVSFIETPCSLYPIPERMASLYELGKHSLIHPVQSFETDARGSILNWESEGGAILHADTSGFETNPMEYAGL